MARARAASVVLIALLWCVTGASGDGHLIDADAVNCSVHDYSLYEKPQSNDTCCHPNCAEGTCSGKEADKCVGKCNSWIEGGGAVPVLGGRGIEVTDDDHGTGSTVMKAVIAVNDAWPDRKYVVLDVDLSGFPSSKFTKSFDADHGALTISGEGTPSEYSDILSTMTYDNTADTPDERDRGVCFWVDDGKLRSGLTCLRVKVQLVNNHAPSVNPTASGQNFVEGHAPVPILSSLVISDPDHPDMFFMVGATVEVTGVLDSDQVDVDVSGVPAITIEGGRGWKRVLVLTGSASINDYKTVLSTARYRSTAMEPLLGPKTITFTVRDGKFSGTGSVTVTVTGINDSPPTIDPGIAADSFIEDAARRERVAVAPNLVLDDPDDGKDYICNVTVEICQPGVCSPPHSSSPDLEFEELNVTASEANLTVMFFPGVGGMDKTRLQIVGTAPKEKYQRLLRSITYDNSRSNISCPIRRYIKISASDCLNTGIGFAPVSIAFRNRNSPEIHAMSRAADYTEGEPPVGFASDLTLSDRDVRCNTSTIHSAEFKFHAPDGSDEMLTVNETLARQIRIEAKLEDGNNGYRVLVLTGVAELKDYQDLLQTAAYENKKDEPNLLQRTIMASVEDGAHPSNVLQFNVTIIPVNDKPPVLELQKANYSYIENGPVVHFGNVELSDGDSKECDQRVIWLEVIIQHRLDGSHERVWYNESLLDEEQLRSSTVTGGFRVSALDTSKGAPLDVFKVLLDSLAYDNTADQPIPTGEPELGQRLVVFKFKTNLIRSVDNDQITQTSVPLYVMGVNDNNPEVDLNGAEGGSDFSTRFIEEGNAVRMSENLAITDPDKEPDTPLVKANISVVNPTMYDQIHVYTNGYGVTVTGNGTGHVEISGEASREVYSHVLRSATYDNTEDEPSPRLAISIYFIVRDKDSRESTPVSCHVTIEEICDPLQLELSTGSLAYAANFSEETREPVAVVASDFVLLDDDAVNIASGTIMIVNVTEGERLRVLDSGGSVAVSSDVKISFAMGVLSFIGRASLAHYKQLIQWVKYDTTNPCPPSLSRRLYFKFVDDCESYNPPAWTDITILPANDPPTLDLDRNSAADPVIVSYTFLGIDNRLPRAKVVFPNTLLLDCDTPDALEYVKVFVTEVGNIETAEEMMIFYVDGTGLMVTNETDVSDFKVTYTIRAINDSDVRPEVFQTVLSTMEYINTASRVFESPRIVTVYASDGSKTAMAMGEIHLDRIPLNPTLELDKDEFNYTVESETSPVHLSFLNGIEITAGDSQFIQEVVIKILNPAQDNVDHLIAPPDNALPMFWQAVGNGMQELVLRSRFPISFVNADQVERTVRMVNFTSTAIRRDSFRNISVVARDSPTRRAGNTVYVVVHVVPLNEQPVVTITSAGSEFSEGGSAVRLYSSLEISDGDGTTLQKATLTVKWAESATCAGGSQGSSSEESINSCIQATANNIKADCIDFLPETKLKFHFSYLYKVTYLELTIMSSSQDLLRSIEEYEALLGTAEYSSYAMEPSNANRIVTLTVMDNKINSDPKTVVVTIAPTNNNPPTLGIAVNSVNFTEGSEPVRLISTSDSISIEDPDCNPDITKAEATLEGTGAMYDWLSVLGDLPNGTTAAYDPSSRTLTISGPGDYKSFLSYVVYGNNMSEPMAGPKNVMFKVFDGVHYSNVSIVTVHILLINDNPPSLDLDSTVGGTGHTATYEEEGPAVAIASNNVAVSDGDNGATIRMVVIRLQNVLNGNDEVVNSTAVDATKSGDEFTFTFSPPMTLQKTEAFLKTLRYVNNHAEPTAGTRNAIVKLNDGVHDSNEATSMIEVTTKNDQPPVFSQASYSGNVSENSPEDTSIATVEATDADSHSTTITYTITGGNDGGHFKVDANGLIATTSVPLDREDDESHTLTVQASDGTFSVTVPVTVTVLDDNDNCPMFGTRSYSKVIASTRGLDSVVVSLHVTDEDESKVFEAAIGAGNDDGLFEISAGNVTVAKELTNFTFTSHSLTVSLSDPSPNCSDTATVDIVIFSSDLEADFEVQENQDSGTVVGQIITDEGFPDTVYSIHPPDAPFSIDQRSTITTTGELDREDVAEYPLIVRFPVGGQTVNVTVQIVVTDLNDKSPVFMGLPYHGTVAENSTVGQSILTVHAIDTDDGVNGQVTYSLPSSYPFDVSADGVVSLKEAVDYEIRCMYAFDVTATDGGDSAKSTDAQVVINITDVNESPPQFEPSDSYNVEISESLPSGSSVVRVRAVDDDVCPEGPPAMISYFFVGSHAGFAIESTSGEISVSGDLNVGVVTLTVQADDGKGRTVTATVTVNVTAVSVPVVDMNGDGTGRDVDVTLLQADPAEVALVAAGALGVVQSGSNINQLTVQITNPQDGASERVTASNLPSGITADYDAGSHTLTLSGSASASSYGEALQGVKYVNDIMTDLFGMSLDSLRNPRNVVVIARDILGTSSVEARATVSFNRSCNSQTAGNQAKVDALAVCDVINGDLVIQCASTIGCDIREVAALSDLTEVTQKLTIDTTKVKNLNGLQNVRSFGSLRIANNAELLTTEDLRLSVAMKAGVVSGVDVVDCGILADVLGLRGITEITGNLNIDDNKLTDLAGLDKLTTVGQHVAITDNQLSTLDGLNMLQTVGGMLTISGNTKLTNIDALRNLRKINGTLTIANHPSLADLDGLQVDDPIDAVGGSILFMFNPLACVDVNFWNGKRQGDSTLTNLFNAPDCLVG